MSESDGDAAKRSAPAVAGPPASDERVQPRPTAPAAPGHGLDFVLDVPLRVTVEIGAARMLIGEVLQLDRGSVVELDRMAGEPADVLVNGRRVARGEITMVEERLAVRILDIEGRPAAGDEAP